MDNLLLVLLLLAGVVWLVARSNTASKQRREVADRAAADLEAARRVAEEDVTRFGEELQGLGNEVLAGSLDQAARQDYQRALDSYESAKASLAAVTRSEEIRHVTEALEDGRYAVACVQARVAGERLPTRRPPCFFNPAHGPSTTDIDWAPAGGQLRQVPVCAADADRVAQGAEPDIRTVPQGVGRVPYWQGGPAYSPWVAGYFGGFAMSGLLPAFLLGSMLSADWDGSDASAGDEGFDTAGGQSEDAGDPGDAGGYDTAGDGGGFDGGGFDGGGFDGGGFDF